MASTTTWYGLRKLCKAVKSFGKAENELSSLSPSWFKSNCLRYVHIIAHSTIWLVLSDQRAHCAMWQKKSHSEHQAPIFASTRVPGDNTTVMIHAINYLTTTNLGVASAHPWFVSAVVACLPNPHWPSEQTLREQGSGWCTPAGRRGKLCNGFSQSFHSEFRVQSSHIPTLYTILSWTEEFRSMLG